MKHLLSLLLLLPTMVLAASPVAGTNGYLKSIGYTDEQLSARVATEDREPFETAEGAGSFADPLGDVVSRSGDTAGIQNAWGDLSDVTLSKNDATQSWDFSLSVGDSIPKTLTSSQKAQWLVYMDVDGDASNNAAAGVRAGTDVEFTVEYNQEAGWYTDFRWYNQPADFWATNKETAATFTFDDEVLTIRVPFAEAPDTLAPRWRTAVAISDGGEMQTDVIPGIGFPPPKGETYPAASFDPAYTTEGDLWASAAATAMLVGYGMFQWVAKKRQT